MVKQSRRKKLKERFAHNKTILWEKVKESLASVIPITVIVLLLCFSIAPVENATLIAFIMGAVLLVFTIRIFKKQK